MFHHKNAASSSRRLAFRSYHGKWQDVVVRSTWHRKWERKTALLFSPRRRIVASFFHSPNNRSSPRSHSSSMVQDPHPLRGIENKNIPGDLNLGPGPPRRSPGHIKWSLNPAGPAVYQRAGKYPMTPRVRVACGRDLACGTVTV
eukprot:585176-Hanusia_phi.AAC.1